MTLFLIAVSVLFIVCRIAQHGLDRYSRSLENPELKAELMKNRKGWSN